MQRTRFTIEIDPLLILPILPGLLVVAGCAGRDCPRELIVNVAYTGTKTGNLVTREFLPGGQFSAFSAGPVGTDAAQLNQVSDGCWSKIASSDEPGGVVEAWIDVDGDDALRCKDPKDKAACSPEAGDPTGTKAYSLQGTGLTTVDLSFGDP
jgi:hypothetical protein